MIHHVFANRSNVGDWLSALGIQKLISPYPFTEHLCDRPFIDNTLRQLRKTTREDLIIIGGGGLFMNYFSPFWKGFRSIAGQTPFCIWGAGFCDLKRHESKTSALLLAEIASKAHLCLVRDALTHSYLGLDNLPPPVPCPSVMVLKKQRKPGWGVLHAANYSTAGADVYHFMRKVSGRFAAETGRSFRETNNQVRPDNRVEFRKVMGLYASSDIVVSSRLHGCIIGLAMGRKVLAVSGDRKVESFMQALGLSDWVCDIKGVEKIPKLLKDLHNQPPVAGYFARARGAHRRIWKRSVGALLGQRS